MERGYLLHRVRSLNKGGKLHAKVEAGSSSFRTDNRRSCCLVRSSRAPCDFAFAKSVGSPGGRLHQRWSALPIRTCLGLPSAFGVLLCTLRPLLRRALAVSITPLALALLADVGLPAVVHLTAFSSRNLPRIDGEVQYVSADRLADEKSGQSYYLARVAVDRNELDRLGPQYKLVPGMPAEVLIVTGERTMFQYLFRPFLDALRRSFREA
jgi:hypothetical protein